MRRAPARPVRACFVRNWCLVSHVTFEAPLRTSHLTVFTLHTTHFTLHTSQSTLHSTRNGVGNCSSKTGCRRQSRKKTILKHFLKGFLKGKLIAPKLREPADKSLSQPGCSHSNTIYDVQLEKTIVLRMQPRHRATLTQPLQCDLQTLSCKTP